MKKCGDSLISEQDLFQSQSGGVIPTSPLQFKLYPCRFGAISNIFKKYHYKGNHIGGGITYNLKLQYRDRILGGAVVGKPRHDSKYKKCLEIRRMACINEAPKNTESYFLSKIIWFIKKHNKDIDFVLSYADLSVGHKGTIYAASNFKCKGETSPTKHIYWNGVRYHPRSLTVERPYSYKLREAIKNGKAKMTTELPKTIWIYDLH